jgi:hypothetical protein
VTRRCPRSSARPRATPAASAFGPLVLPKAAPFQGREHFETLEVHTRDTWSSRPRWMAAHRRAQRSIGVRLPGRAGRGSAAVRAGLTGPGTSHRETWPSPCLLARSIRPRSVLPCELVRGRRHCRAGRRLPFLTHSLGSAAAPPPSSALVVARRATHAPQENSTAPEPGRPRPLPAGAGDRCRQVPFRPSEHANRALGDPQGLSHPLPTDSDRHLAGIQQGRRRPLPGT